MSVEAEDEILLQSLFAQADRAPLGDERFVGSVMKQVGRETARAQSRLQTLVWIGGAVTAFFAATNFTAIVAEISKAAAVVPVPINLSMNAGVATMLLVAAASAGAWLVSERN